MPLAQRSLYTSIAIELMIERKDVSDCKTDVYILVRDKQAGPVIKVRAASKAQPFFNSSAAIFKRSCPSRSL